MSKPDYQAEMRLPEGGTCADCQNARRCVAFGFSRSDATDCDFHPSRYRAAQEGSERS